VPHLVRRIELDRHALLCANAKGAHGQRSFGHGFQAEGLLDFDFVDRGGDERARFISVAARYIACDRCPASSITARYALAWLRYFQKLRSKRDTSAICSGAPA